MMIRRPRRYTESGSSAAADVDKRQGQVSASGAGSQSRRRQDDGQKGRRPSYPTALHMGLSNCHPCRWHLSLALTALLSVQGWGCPVSYTHLRAHETVLDLVCCLLLDKKKTHYTSTPENYTLNKNNITNLRLTHVDPASAH